MTITYKIDMVYILHHMEVFAVMGGTPIVIICHHPFIYWDCPQNKPASHFWSTPMTMETPIEVMTTNHY